MADKELGIRLSADTKGFNRAIKSAADAVEVLEERLGRIVTKQQLVQEAMSRTQRAETSRIIVPTDVANQMREELKLSQELAEKERTRAEQEARFKEMQSRATLADLEEKTAALRKLAQEEKRVQENNERYIRSVAASNREWDRTHPILNKIRTKLGLTRTQAEKMSEGASKFFNWLKRSTTPANTLLSTLRRIAATYLSIQSLKTAITTSDDITSAKNRLNYANANALGDDLAVNSTGEYSNQVMNMTKEQMDKMYTASQKANSSYIDMMHNTSKMMALAGDAFDGSTDAAIRFNEVMAKAYTIGGSSASEISSSMMQLTQALASGTLQGDELRSVRENAPLAYKAIEEVAQRVWNTTDSLKELGSQGKVSAEMIVNAVLGMGDKIDTAFERTQIQFNHIWQKIKNAAVKAFEPVSERLSEILTDAVNNGALEKIEIVFAKVSKVLVHLLDKIEQGVTWVIENWEPIKNTIIGVLTAIFTWTAMANTACAIYAVTQAVLWLRAEWTLAKYGVMVAAVAMLIIALIAIFVLWKTGAIDTCEAIQWAILAIGIVATIVLSIITGGLVLIPLIVAVVIFAIIEFLDYLLAAIYWLVGLVINLFIGMIDGMIQHFYSHFVEPVAGIIEWFVNAFNGAFDGVGGAFKNLCGQLLSGLIGLVKPFAKLLDKIFGWDTNGAIEAAQANMKSWGKTDAAVTYTVKAPTVSSLTSSLGWDVGDRVSLKGMWNKGMEHGGAAQDWLANLGSDSQNWNLAALNNSALLSDVTAPTIGANQYSNLPSLGDDQLQATCDDINGDTSNIADSMELTAEDLKYFRDVANMEWKKEYTTATIQIDMTNNNTISKEVDMDGFWVKLTDTLHEEMSSMADGVYAY